MVVGPICRTVHWEVIAAHTRTLVAPVLRSPHVVFRHGPHGTVLAVREKDARIGRSLCSASALALH
jgi:hypothetical protein